MVVKIFLALQLVFAFNPLLCFDIFVNDIFISPAPPLLSSPSSASPVAFSAWRLS